MTAASMVRSLGSMASTQKRTLSKNAVRNWKKFWKNGFCFVCRETSRCRPMSRYIEIGYAKPMNKPELIEELANGITHGIGLALSVVGLGVLAVLAVLRGNAWHIAGCLTFGVTLVLLYGASTLYHSF